MSQSEERRGIGNYSNHVPFYRKSQLLALLLCIGSVDVAIGNVDAEQRLLDVLRDFHSDGILTMDCGTE